MSIGPFRNRITGPRWRTIHHWYYRVIAVPLLAIITLAAPLSTMGSAEPCDELAKEEEPIEELIQAGASTNRDILRAYMLAKGDAPPDPDLLPESLISKGTRPGYVSLARSFHYNTKQRGAKFLQNVGEFSLLFAKTFGPEAREIAKEIRVGELSPSYEEEGKAKVNDPIGTIPSFADDRPPEHSQSKYGGVHPKRLS